MLALQRPATGNGPKGADINNHENVPRSEEIITHPGATRARPLRSELLSAALGYAGRGWPVFPCKPGDKKPLVRWREKASTDPRRITAWWSKWPAANVAVVTGPDSGLLVLDVDDPAGLDDLEGEHGELPKTYTTATGSGGMHYYYRFPAGENVRNSAGKLAAGLDVRAAGGYVVAPPSATTRPYELLDDLPLDDPPAWLLEALRRPERPASGHEQARVSDRGEAKSGDGSGPIPEGRRNWTLYRRACSLRARGDGQAAILEALELENRDRCTPPLEAEELEQIAASAARHEPGSSSAGEPNQDTLEALERIADRLLRREWRGMGEKSARDVYAALIKLARVHGEKIPAGVRVSVGIRPLALAAAVSKPTAMKAVRRLRVAGLVRKDDADRSGTKAGAFVLLDVRANLYHSTTPARLEGKGVASGQTLRAPLTAPRLRWSAPEIRRMGKTAGAVLDALEAAGGELELGELAAAVGIKRPRDLRRRVIPRLEEAAVVECSGDTVALRGDWLTALNQEREVSGEIAAYRRDMARYARERDAYSNRHKVRPEPVPKRSSAGGEPEPGELPLGELVRVSPLAGALDEYLRRNPREADQLPGYLAGTLWAYELIPGKVGAPEITAALEELGGDDYRRRLFEAVRSAA